MTKWSRQLLYEKPSNDENDIGGQKGERCHCRFEKHGDGHCGFRSSQLTRVIADIHEQAMSFSNPCRQHSSLTLRTTPRLSVDRVGRPTLAITSLTSRLIIVHTFQKFTFGNGENVHLIAFTDIDYFSINTLQQKSLSACAKSFHPAVFWSLSKQQSHEE